MVLLPVIVTINTDKVPLQFTGVSFNQNSKHITEKC